MRMWFLVGKEIPNRGHWLLLSVNMEDMEGWDQEQHD